MICWTLRTSVKYRPDFKPLGEKKSWKAQTALTAIARIRCSMIYSDSQSTACPHVDDCLTVNCVVKVKRGGGGRWLITLFRIGSHLCSSQNDKHLLNSLPSNTLQWHPLKLIRTTLFLCQHLQMTLLFITPIWKLTFSEPISQVRYQMFWKSGICLKINNGPLWRDERTIVPLPSQGEGGGRLLVSIVFFLGGRVWIYPPIVHTACLPHYWAGLHGPSHVAATYGFSGAIRVVILWL